MLVKAHASPSVEENRVKDCQSEITNSSLGILNFFQKFLLGLIHMRLNLSGRDLGYIFEDISEATVSRTFLHVVNVLYHRLKPLVIWPEGVPFVKLFPWILASTVQTVLSLSIVLKYSWTAL